MTSSFLKEELRSNLYKDKSELITLVDSLPIFDRHVKNYVNEEKAISRGRPISPMIMNVFLHRFDTELEKVMGAPSSTTSDTRMIYYLEYLRGVIHPGLLSF